MNPITVLKKVVDGIKGFSNFKAAFDGIRDERSTFSSWSWKVGTTIWSSRWTLSVMSKAIKNYKLAKDIIRSGAKEGGKIVCIEILIRAASYCM